MLASFPASMVNQKPADLGIQNRFNLTTSRFSPMIERITEEIENLLYPELRPYRRSDRTRLLRKASETPLDSVEWVGILVALVLVVSVTRYGGADFGLVDRIAVALVNFLAAILLLGVTAGPFLIRRTRRGLRSQLY